MSGLYAQTARQSAILPLFYGQVREDVTVDLQALALTERDRVLTITSGGCSALRFLAESPLHVTAIDINASQSALLALKCAAIAQWDRQTCRAFLGDLPASARERIQGLQTLQPRLSQKVHHYWATHLKAVASGVNHAGRTDRLSVCVGWVLHYLTHFPTLFKALMALETIDEQREFYHTRFDTWRWRAFLSMCVNRVTLRGVYGRGFSQYLAEHESPAIHLRRKVARAFETTLIKHNPLMTQLLFGCNPPGQEGAQYLMKGVYDKVKTNLNRLTIVTEDLATWIVQPEQQGRFSKMALSNAIECLPTESVAPFLQHLAHALPPESVVVTRSMMGRWCRRWPDDLQLDRPLSVRLTEVERAYMYSEVSVFRKCFHHSSEAKA